MENINSDTRALLWLDALGFGNFITENDLGSSLAEYRIMLGNFINQNNFLKFNILSDSLLFWYDLSEHDNIRKLSEDEHLNRMLKEMSVMCDAAHSMLGNLFGGFYGNSRFELFRGAIVLDEYFTGETDISSPMRKETYSISPILGKSIVYAHRWESDQDWCLVSIHPRYNQLVELFLEKTGGNISSQTNIIIKYQIPTKTGLIDGYVINPFDKNYFSGKRKKFLNDNHTGEFVEEAVYRIHTYEDYLTMQYDKATDPRAKSKIENTIKFFKYVEENDLFVTNQYTI